ncbi:hypothetical protein FACS1894219_05680 [Clostridia bacterium]|nr:hypothetical protein FACS1894219_05680 [Clostridia bacterium]
MRTIKMLLVLTVILFSTHLAVYSDDEPRQINYTLQLVNVVVPADIDFTIDPFELAGRGQVYADPYVIENHGTNSVLITFTDMNVIFANDTDFKALTQPFDEFSESEYKSVYLVLDFGIDTISPVVLTDYNRAKEVTIPLNADENSNVTIGIIGSVNHAPAVDWANDDVKISLTYSIMQIFTSSEISDSIELPEETDLQTTESAEAEVNTTDESIEVTESHSQDEKANDEFDEEVTTICEPKTESKTGVPVSEGDDADGE